jgi:hypothetical protein
MPRVTALKAEIGTTGEIRRLDLVGDARGDVWTAVLEEHRCDDSSCDIIGEALRAGYPMTAAWLLVGATETPLLGRVLDHYGVDSREFPDDWEQWKEHFNEYGRKCEACGSFTFADDYWEPEECGNCLAPLPPRPCEDCDGLGFLAGAHTERVEPCPTCREEDD